MIEHKPWVGSEYRGGIKGQSVGIVGYSHWYGDDRIDDEDLTITCIRKVMSGEEPIAFFTQIRNYFGYGNHQTFWPRVVFFNFLPECVGGGGDRYGNGTEEQRSRGKERFQRIMREKQLDKVLILTGRRWAFPSPDSGFREFGPFLWGSYAIDNRTINAYFLRHPQGANGHIMRKAVMQALGT